MIFVIPEFAKRFKTLGGVREDDIERLHNETNRILTGLISVREQSIKFLLTLERLELKRAVPSTQATHTLRKFKCKYCPEKPVLVDKVCQICGWKKD